MTALAFAVPRRSVRVATRRHTPARRSARSRVGRRHTNAARRNVTWELRSFVGASAAIAVAFVLALAYLASSTGVATAGYEAQRLEVERDELRRRNALLELEIAKLSSPARIETEARRLGLVRLPFIPVLTAEPLAAQR